MVNQLSDLQAALVHLFTGGVIVAGIILATITLLLALGERGGR